MAKCICDKCGAEFEITPHRRIDGDIEIVFLKCTSCGEEYLVSVTDSVLRDAIEEYKRRTDAALAAADPATSEALFIEARKINDDNLRRCRELKTQIRETSSGKSAT